MSQPFQRKTKLQLQRHIREVARNSAAVFVTVHAKQRMAQRKVLLNEVLECLRQGVIHLEPEADLKTGDLICRMERYVCGRNLAACVALDDDDPDLIVVTVLVL